MRAAVLLLPAVLLLGCLSGEPAPGVEDAACAPLGLSVLHAAPEASGVVPRVSGEPVQLLYWLRGSAEAPSSARVRVEPPSGGGMDPAEGPEESGPEGVPHAIPAEGPAFGAYRVEPGPEPATLRLVADRAGAEACAAPAASVPLALGAPVEANATGRTGVGVLVRTAGFWVNGTTFYTNDARVHEDPAIPKGYLGPFTDDAPLPVYVYADGERTMPKRYYDAGYYTTIAGFNKALRDIAVGAPVAAYLAPEEAYTRLGNDAHPLYGDPLVFWITAVEVVDLPCPLPQPACDVPVYPARPPPLPVLVR